MTNSRIFALTGSSLLAAAAIAGGVLAFGGSSGEAASASPLAASTDSVTSSQSSVLTLLQAQATDEDDTTSDRQATQEAYLQALADQLGISLDELKAALKDVSLAQLDQKVADGTITQEQADEIRARIEAGETGVRFGFGGKHGRGGGKGGFGMAGASTSEIATFLGVDEATLRDDLRSGTTLADAAEAAGKSRDELKAFLTAEYRAHLDEEVAEGDLTQEEADAKLAEKTAELDAKIDGTTSSGHGPRGERDDDSGDDTTVE